MITYPQRNNGFTVLISVLMVGGVAVSVGLTLVTLGIHSLQNVGLIESGMRSRMYTHTCIEQALKDIQSTLGESSGGTVTFDDTNCEYIITDLGDESRRIVASTIVNDSHASITVEIDSFTEQISITSWEE